MLGPVRDDRIRLCEIAAVLRAEAAEVVVILAAGKELPQGRVTILGQGQRLAKFQIHRRSIC